MSLAEIEEAVKGLNREELAKLAAYIARQDKLVWDDELEEDRDPLDAVCDAVEELALEAPGDVLIFFSGEREIRDAAEALAARIQGNRRLAGTEILPLFARLSLQEQHKVFHPGGKRRIGCRHMAARRRHRRPRPRPCRSP